MRLFSELADCAQSVPTAFKGLVSQLDPAWIEEALKAIATGSKAITRRRKLPAEQVLWLVIGMALFRDRSILEVVHHLDLVIEKPGKREGVSQGAIPKARRRLGAGPVERLFELSASAWSAPTEEDRRLGLSLWAMDGSCMSVPYSDENAQAFSQPTNDSGAAAFPQLRLSALMNLRTHVLAGLSVGDYSQGELTLMTPLWALLPDHSMCLVDAGLQSWRAFYDLRSTGTERHWMTPTKSSFSCKVVRSLGPGDDLVEVSLHSRARKGRPDIHRKLVMRRVSIVRPGFRAKTFITSALDPVKYPASELAALYFERWEIEIGYGEIKTQLLECEDLLRSKSPDGIRQEVFGIALAYNLVRLELARVAQQQGVPPRRMSFRHGLMLIRNFMLTAWATPAGALPRRLASLGQDLRLLVLPERRNRHYERSVLLKRRRYPTRSRAKQGVSVL